MSVGLKSLMGRIMHEGSRETKPRAEVVSRRYGRSWKWGIWVLWNDFLCFGRTVVRSRSRLLRSTIGSLRS